MTFLQDTSPFRIVTFVASVIPIIAMWILFACRLMVPIDLQLAKYRYHFLLLETIIVVGVLVLLSRVFYGQCPSLRIWYCNPGARVKGLPGDIMISLIALPLLFKIMLPFISYYMVILSFIIALSFIVSAIVISQSFTSLSTVIILSLLIGGAGYCYRIQHMYMRYNETLRLRALDFKERTERLRTGMGNILSSICHDMKTVSLHLL